MSVEEIGAEEGKEEEEEKESRVTLSYQSTREVAMEMKDVRATVDINEEADVRVSSIINKMQDILLAYSPAHSTRPTVLCSRSNGQLCTVLYCSTSLSRFCMHIVC